VDTLGEGLEEFEHYRARRDRRLRLTLVLAASSILGVLTVVAYSAEHFGSPAAAAKFAGLLPALLACWGSLIGYYFGASVSVTTNAKSEFNDLNIYREAIRAREETVALRSLLLKEHAELERKLREQDQIIAELKADGKIKSDK
jgi:hypothetical protein